MESFENRNAVITGAASGVGAALAVALDAEGANLMLLDRDDAGLARVASGLRGGPLTMALDVTDAAAVRHAAETAFAAWSNVHLICSNAGIMPPVLPLWELGEADFSKPCSRSTWPRSTTLSARSCRGSGRSRKPHTSWSQPRKQRSSPGPS